MSAPLISRCPTNPLVDTSDPVVISGVGMVTPLGENAVTSWSGLCRGESSGQQLDGSDFSGIDCDVIQSRDARWIGSPARTFTPDHCDRVADLALKSATEAILDANLEASVLPSSRTGCVFGTSKGSMFAASRAWRMCENGGVNPWLSGPAVGLEALVQHYAIGGPSLCPVAACATGVTAVIRGAQLVASNECDVVIAGSADDSLHPLVLASFQRLGVLASRHVPSQASRPFDADRNGFVIGAGAATLILERRSHAAQRRATWYAELGRGILQSDPTGMTSLDESGRTLARLIQQCLPSNPAKPITPDVINLHGTGTRMNDVAECRAVELALGPLAQQPLCGSFKGSLGHLLGAAGSVELALCCLMLRDQRIPPNVNLDRADDLCPLHWSRRLTKQPIQSVLKLSLGFGGHQAGLWLNRGTRRPLADDSLDK